MIKRRKMNINEPTQEQIEAFGDEAESSSAKGGASLDPDAARTYKAIRVPFNEYEFQRLEEASAKVGRTKLNLIRRAILAFADEVL